MLSVKLGRGICIALRIMIHRSNYWPIGNTVRVGDVFWLFANCSVRQSGSIHVHILTPRSSSAVGVEALRFRVQGYRGRAERQACSNHFTQRSLAEVLRYIHSSRHDSILVYRKTKRVVRVYCKHRNSWTGIVLQY